MTSEIVALASGDEGQPSPTSVDVAERPLDLPFAVRVTAVPE